MKQFRHLGDSEYDVIMVGMVGSIPTGSLFRDLGTEVKTNPFALAIRLQKVHLE